MQPLTGDPPADAYLVRLVARAADLVGDAFVGGYLLNSGARGDYLAGRSDLDVALIVSGALDDRTKRSVADASLQDELPCPAPRLELVVYRRDVASRPGSRPPFELNLNTGAAIADRAMFDPADEPWFWFLLDLGAAADAARAIAGPPATEIFGAVPRHAVLEALRASHRWHLANEAGEPNRVLNACRAWCWIATSRWQSKAAAASWAIEAGADPELVRHALARRAGERHEALPAERVDRFMELVARAIDEAAETERHTA